MLFLLCVWAAIFGFCPREAFVLHPSQGEPERAVDSVSDTLVGKVNRCQGESIQVIKQKLLEALNLDKEPQVARGGLTRLREQWKATLGLTAHISLKPQEVIVLNTTSTQEASGNRDAINSASSRCCQLASQIFIKDLGWENWIIYPESFTHIQCVVCTTHLDPKAPLCRANSPPSQCCQPTAQEMLPFLYLDELNTAVITQVTLASQCGCKPGSESRDAGLQDSQN